MGPNIGPTWAPRGPPNRPKSASEIDRGSPFFGFDVGKPWETDLGAILGSSWPHLVAILGPSWAILGHLGAILGSSWAILGHIAAPFAIFPNLKTIPSCASGPSASFLNLGRCGRYNRPRSPGSSASPQRRFLSLCFSFALVVALALL